jgi:hypothetical protein
MAGSEPTPEEFAAAEFVTTRYGGTYEPRDAVHAPDGMHDFDVHLAGGRRIALEVTRIADADVVSFFSAAMDREWPAPHLRNDWYVAVPEPGGTGPPVNIRRAAAVILPALAVLAPILQ